MNRLLSSPFSLGRIQCLAMRPAIRSNAPQSLSTTGISLQKRNNSGGDRPGIDVSHLWGESPERVFRYLRRHNMMPDVQEGSKGYGLEGHKLDFGVFPDMEPVVIKAPHEYPRELEEKLLEPSGKELVEMVDRDGKEGLSPRMLKLYKKYKRRQKIKDANYEKTQ